MSCFGQFFVSLYSSSDAQKFIDHSSLVSDEVLTGNVTKKVHIFLHILFLNVSSKARAAKQTREFKTKPLCHYPSALYLNPFQKEFDFTLLSAIKDPKNHITTV